MQVTINLPPKKEPRLPEVGEAFHVEGCSLVYIRLPDEYLEKCFPGKDLDRYFPNLSAPDHYFPCYSLVENRVYYCDRDHHRRQELILLKLTTPPTFTPA